MKVLLNSLPVPDMSPGFQRGNHQLFAAYTRSLAEKRNMDGITIKSLPREILDGCTDRAIADAIGSSEPGLAGFSLYVWNRERSLRIARFLREKGIHVVAGGPEALSLSREEHRDDLPFDSLFTGEAEKVFLDYVSVFRKSGESARKIQTAVPDRPRIVTSDGPVDFTAFSGILCLRMNEYIYDGLAYLETERGCPFSCSYCSYAKGRKRLTTMPIDLFTACIDILFDKPIEELYLLAPTLNRIPSVFRERLRYLAEKQKNRSDAIKIFGEIRPELIGVGDPELMHGAGFREIELGIQTLNPESGEYSGRRVFGPALLDRAEEMAAAGIKPILDFILGLPGDTPERMFETVEILHSRRLLEYSSFYRLQVLPGTAMRDRYLSEGWDFQRKPPYFTIANDTSTEDDIAAVYRYLDEEKDHGYSEELSPDVPGGVHVFERPGDEKTLLSSPYLHTASLTICAAYPGELLKSVLSSYFEEHPEVFHRAYLLMPAEKDDATGTEACLRLADECSGLMNGFPNGYDAYRCGKGDPVLSKKVEVLVPPSADDGLIGKILGAGLDAGFYLTDEQEAAVHSRRLAAYREDWGLPAYAGRSLKEMMF